MVQAIQTTGPTLVRRVARVRVAAVRASSMQPNLPHKPARKSVVSKVAMVPDAREVVDIPLMPNGEVHAWLVESGHRSVACTRWPFCH